MIILAINNFTAKTTVREKSFSQKPVFCGVKDSSIKSTSGIFSDTGQKALENLHKNLKEIQELFLIFEHYPSKAIAIKDGYPGLLQKNRNQGLAFALPNDRGNIIIRQLRIDSSLLRFVVQDNNKKRSFLTKGFTQSVANINQSNPQFLPRNFRYMTQKEIQDSNIEEYIKLADEEINNYNQYLKQFRNPEKRNELQVQKKKPAKNPANKQIVKKAKSNVNKPNTKTQTKYLKSFRLMEYSSDSPIKDCAKTVTKIFENDPLSFPPDLIPEINKLNKIKSISTKTDRNSVLTAERKVDLNYGNNMIYLKFTEQMSNGSVKYLGIDLNTYQVLKMTQNGKPLIRFDNVYEYNDSELKTHKLIERLTYYKNQLCKNAEDSISESTVLKPAETEKFEQTDIKTDTIEKKDLFNKLIIKAANKINDISKSISSVDVNEKYSETALYKLKNFIKKLDRLKKEFDENINKNQ